MKILTSILLLFLSVIISFTGYSADRYWVGGTGNWNNTANWSATSGGASGASVPGVADNAIIDAFPSTAGATITVDVAASVVNFDFSAAPAFNLAVANSITVSGSLTANGTATISLTGGFNIFSAAPASLITSNGQAWNSNFNFTASAAANGVILADNFSTSGNIAIGRGIFDSDSMNITCFNFNSGVVGARNIKLNASTINVDGIIWNIAPGTGPNPLTWSATNSTINLLNAGTVVFTGGGLAYANLNSSASSLEIINNNTFSNAVLLSSSTLKLNNSSTNTFTTLVANGTCGAPFNLQASNPVGAAANLSITTSPWSASGLNINKVNAIAPTVYNIMLSFVASSTGWTQVSAKFYWIGSTGNWQDGTQWSATSGGPTINCVPTATDSVFFDANSFVGVGNIVTVDDDAAFKAMKWIGIVGNQTLALDSNMMAYGDIVLHNNLTLKRNINASGIQINKPSDFYPNNATIDCNFLIKMSANAETFTLKNQLIASDSSSILFFQGRMDTQGNKIVLGSIRSINDTGSPSETRNLTAGSSFVHVKRVFDTSSDTDFSLTAGTSHFYIGDTLVYLPDTVNHYNTLQTSNLIFHDVTLNFQPLISNQLVSGNNTFNKFRIIHGSKVAFKNNSTQTINDSLILIGHCQDSIFVYSDGANQFNWTKPGTKVIAQCLKLEDCNISTAQTAYFSRNITNNTNWTFNTTILPITGSYTSSSPDCFGSITTLTPSLTASQGGGISYQWSFNDGSGTIFTADSIVATKTAVLNYTNPAGINDTLNAQLVNWVEVVDPQGMFNPVLGNLKTAQNAEGFNFTIDLDYDFNLVNTTPGTVYLVDMNSSSSTARYKYKPRLSIYKNGTPFWSSSPSDFELFIQNEGAIATGTTNLGSDTANLTVSLNILPTDVLTFYVGTDVTYTGYSTQPRFKLINSDLGPDAQVNYQIDVNSIRLKAVPKASFVADTTQHTFLSQGSFPVVLVATNELNQCKVLIQDTIDIFGPVSLLTTSEIDTTVCQGNSVTFEVSSSTPGSLFEFFVNGTSQNTPSATDTLFTTSTLSNLDTVYAVAHAGGCSSINNPQFVMVVDSLPSFTLTSSDLDTSICAGTPVNFTVTPNGGTTTFKYFLNNTSVTGYTSAGTYSNSALVNGDVIKVYGKTASGCIDSTFMIFDVLPLPNVGLNESTTDLTICAGESVSFTAFGADTYEFFINGVSQGAPSATATWNTTSIANGNTVSVRGYYSTGCSKLSTTTYTYVVNALPNVSVALTPGNTICSGTNVVATASGASLYQFFVNGTSQGPASPTNTISSASYANNTTFYVVGTFNGCLGTSSTQTLTVNTSPTTTLSSSDADNSICAGTPVTFTALGANTYQFFINGVSQGAPSALNTLNTSTLSNGNIISVVGQSNGCTVSQQLTFTVLNNPNVQLFSTEADNTICAGNSITFTGANASQYQLYVNGTAVAGPQASPVFTNPSLPTLTNTVYVIGTAANGCSGQSSSIVTTVNPLPTVTMTSSDADNIICAGTPVTFTGGGGTQYQFFVNGTAQGSMSSTNTFTTNSLTNLQTIQVTGSLLGCVNTSSVITMTVNPLPALTFTSTDMDNAYCQGDVVTYNAGGASTYQFFVNGVSQGAPSAVSSINSASFATGVYPVSVTGSALGCSTSSSMTITVNSIPTATLVSSDVDNTICSGEVVTYTATGGSMYLFAVNGTPVGSPTPISNFTTTTLTNGNVVSATVTSAQGCVANSTLPSITVNPVPTTNLISSDLDNQICVGDNVTFTASGATNYEFFINGVSQGAPSATTTFSTSGLANGQTIVVTGSAFGCTDNSNPITFAVFGPPVVQLFNNGVLTLCTGQPTNLLASGATNYQFTVNGTPVGAFSPTATFNAPVNNGDIISVIGQTNGCSNASSDNYTFAVNTYPSIVSNSSDADNVICLNDLVTFTTSGAATYEFEINGSMVQSGTSGTFSLNTLANGDVVSVTGFNGTCASSVTNYPFVVNSMALDLAIAPSSLICTGETATFTASGAEQYQFFINGVSQGAMSATSSLSTTVADQDEITFTGYSSVTGCTQVYDDYILMNVMDQPVITASTSLDICEGDSVILYSNAAEGNQWYLNGAPIAGATDTAYVAYTSGDYSLETNAGGLGVIRSFGYNAQGTFGDGTNINNPDPTAANSTATFDELSTGYGFILGVTTTGAVYAWGDNSSGQLGNGTYTSSNLPNAVPSLANVKTVATSENSAMAVTNTGTVYVWGNNAVGQLATGNTSVINFPFLNNNLTNVDTIAGGKQHFVILKNDGTVWTVGNNDFGQLGQGNLNASMMPLQVAGLSNVVSVGAGEYHSFAINNAGDLYVWGNNGSGQLGLNDLDSRLTPVMSSLRNIINAQGGAAHSVFLSSDKKVFTSGNNTHGQLGNGNFTDQLVPVEASVSGAVMISAGEYTSLVKRQDNSVFGFGSNIEQQLSSTNGNGINTPEYISDLDGVSFIEAGRFASHVIYNEQNACISAVSTVNMLAVPVVPITETGGILSTIAGDSYQWYFDGAIIPGATSQTYQPAAPAAGGNYSVAVTFANGCTGYSADFYFGPADLDEIAFGLSVYPNPTSGILNIVLTHEVDPTNATLILRDMSGRVILEQNIESDKVQLDLQDLAVGNYLIELNIEGQIQGRIQIMKTH